MPQASDFLSRIKSFIIVRTFAVFLTTASIIMTVLAAALEILVATLVIKPEYISAINTISLSFVCASFILSGIIVNTRLRHYIVSPLRFIMVFLVTLTTLGLCCILAYCAASPVAEYIGEWKYVGDVLKNFVSSILISFIFFVILMYFIVLPRKYVIQALSKHRDALYALLSKATSSIKKDVESTYKTFTEVIASFMIGAVDISRILWLSIMFTAVFLVMISLVPKVPLYLLWIVLYILVVVVILALVFYDLYRYQKLQS